MTTRERRDGALQLEWDGVRRAIEADDHELAVHHLATMAEVFHDWSVDLPLADLEGWLRDLERDEGVNPWVRFLLAWVWSTQRRHRAALVTLRQVEQAFATWLTNHPDAQREALFLVRTAIGVVCERDGRVDEAGEAFESALAAADWDLAGLDLSADERRWIAGDPSGFMAFYVPARRLFERRGLAASLARACHNIGTRLLDRGEPHPARRMLEEAAEIKREHASRLALGNSLNSLAVAERQVGLADRARGHLEQAIAFSEQHDHPLLTSYALNNLAEVERDAGRFAVALEAYESSLALKRERDDPFGLAHSLASLADCHLYRGAAVDALACSAEALQLRVPGPDELEAARLRACHARARLSAGVEAEAAVHDLQDAAVSFRAFDAKADLAVASLWLGGGLALIGQEVAASRAVAEALDLARIWQLESVLAPAIALHPELVREAASRSTGALAHSAADEVLPTGATARPAGTPPLEPGVQPVAVFTLGHFGLVHRGLPAPDVVWRSKRARELLKLLIARRGHPVPRDWLAEMLWPGGDPERVGNRLSVALSTVRRALDGGRGFDPDHFIVADRETVALDLEHVWVDVEAFLDHAEQGLHLLRDGDPAAAMEHLRQAERLYGGEFCEANRYDDWATPLREEARTLHGRVIAALTEGARPADQLR